ncbi:MAG: type II toxin-antitoxin system RelE/ParE family toxin, partial [Acidobacteriota bacterium]
LRRTHRHLRYVLLGQETRSQIPPSRDGEGAGSRFNSNVPFMTQWSLLDRSKKLPASFYLSANGREPVRDWILALSPEDRKLVGRDIQKVEFGWPLGMPYCRSLGQGLWEVRSDLTRGKIARVIFCIARNQMVLLHGFVKKTQKTPQLSIDLALKRMQEVK